MGMLLNLLLGRRKIRWWKNNRGTIQGTRTIKLGWTMKTMARTELVKRKKLQIPASFTEKNSDFLHYVFFLFFAPACRKIRIKAHWGWICLLWVRITRPCLWPFSIKYELEDDERLNFLQGTHHEKFLRIRSAIQATRAGLRSQREGHIVSLLLLTSTLWSWTLK